MCLGFRGLIVGAGHGDCAGFPVELVGECEVHTLILGTKKPPHPIREDQMGRFCLFGGWVYVAACEACHHYADSADDDAD